MSGRSPAPGSGPETWPELAGATVLVVGGAGFVGSSLVRALLAGRPRRVIVVDNLLSSERDNLPGDERLDFIEASINDDDVLAALPRTLDYAFHLATFHGNQNSIADPLADHEHNTLTSLKLFEALKDLSGLRAVVYAGAGCTVAEKTHGPAAATDEDAPVSLYLDSPYQISKIVGELYGNYYFGRYGLPVVKARFQNVYGPGEVLGAGRWRGTIHTVWRNVVPTFIYRALKGLPLIVENGGGATRDFIHVFDIVRGLILCALRGGAGEVYNLAGGVETSIRTLAETIIALAGGRTSLEIGPARDWDRSGRRYGSTAKAAAALSFTSRIGLESGLADTIEWTAANMDRIDACIARHDAHLVTLT